MEFSYIYRRHLRLKRKIAPFIFGVTVGLLIGVAIFVFKINDVFLKLKESASGRVTIIEQPVKNVPVKEPKKAKSERFRIDASRQKKVNYREVDSLIADDADINIAREELVTVKQVKPIIVNDNLAAANDSASAGSAKTAGDEAAPVFVEFWRTPLNSRGYRFSRNKLMLYGFADPNVLIYDLDNTFYLKISDKVYRLFPGGEFRQMERVVDAELVAKLN